MTKTKSYDKKIFRLWSILNKLDTGGKVFTAKLAKDFNVSIRSVQRDVELLNMVGFPVVSRGKGCYGFIEGFSLKRIMISEEDASLLSFLYEIAKSLGGKFENSFNGILKKILKPDIESPFYVKMPAGMKLSEEFPFVSDIESAIDERKKMAIEYSSDKKTKKYTVDPLKIIFFEGFWYLLANIDDKDNLRKFRLDMIESMEITEEEYDLPDNLKTILDESVNVWFEEKKDRTVVLKVDRQVSKYFKKKQYFPQQVIKKENKDGSVIIESSFSDDMEIIPTVLHWIPWVKVVSPEAIKAKVLSLVVEYAKSSK
ncbi:MAG: WYL domain-containing protein [Candidatus Omnitrophota bacterium]